MCCIKIIFWMNSRIIMILLIKLQSMTFPFGQNELFWSHSKPNGDQCYGEEREWFIEYDIIIFIQHFCMITWYGQYNITEWMLLMKRKIILPSLIHARVNTRDLINRLKFRIPCDNWSTGFYFLYMNILNPPLIR